MAHLKLQGKIREGAKQDLLKKLENGSKTTDQLQDGTEKFHGMRRLTYNQIVGLLKELQAEGKVAGDVISPGGCYSTTPWELKKDNVTLRGMAGWRE